MIPNADKGKPMSKRLEAVEVQDSATKPLSEGQPARAPVEGFPLPPGLKNPKLGEHGHRCLDERGNYQPSWSCVFIHRSGEVAEKQAFLDKNGDTIHVRTNEWVDVPPEVVGILECTKVAAVVRGGLSGQGLIRAMAETDINATPRWQYSIITSG